MVWEEYLIVSCRFGFGDGWLKRLKGIVKDE